MKKLRGKIKLCDNYDYKNMRIGQDHKNPYEIYQTLGAIPANEAIPPATQVRKSIRKILNAEYKK